MQIIASELVHETPRNVKFLLSAATIAFFPGTQQHRDFKSHGLSYEDDYRGNAVAGLVTAGRVEIRFHPSYSAERITALWAQVLAAPELAGVNLGTVYYQGTPVQ